MLWDNFSAKGLYGVPQQAPGSAHLDNAPGVATIAGPSPSSGAAWFSPEHPLFVFGVLLAAAAGLIGIAGSARVGPAKGSVNLGKA